MSEWKRSSNKIKFNMVTATIQVRADLCSS